MVYSFLKSQFFKTCFSIYSDLCFKKSENVNLNFNGIHKIKSVNFFDLQFIISYENFIVFQKTIYNKSLLEQFSFFVSFYHVSFFDFFNNSNFLETLSRNILEEFKGIKSIANIKTKKTSYHAHKKYNLTHRRIEEKFCSHICRFFTKIYIQV